jgi:hypothetical protein
MMKAIFGQFSFLFNFMSPHLTEYHAFSLAMFTNTPSQMGLAIASSIAHSKQG